MATASIIDDEIVVNMPIADRPSTLATTSTAQAIPAKPRTSEHYLNRQPSFIGAEVPTHVASSFRSGDAVEEHLARERTYAAESAERAASASFDHRETEKFYIGGSGGIGTGARGWESPPMMRRVGYDDYRSRDDAYFERTMLDSDLRQAHDAARMMNFGDSDLAMGFQLFLAERRRGWGPFAPADRPFGQPVSIHSDNPSKVVSSQPQQSVSAGPSVDCNPVGVVSQPVSDTRAVADATAAAIAELNLLSGLANSSASPAIDQKPPVPSSVASTPAVDANVVVKVAVATEVKPKSKKPMTVAPFDGSMPLDIFLKQFNTCANYNDWSEEDKGAHLCVSLKGDAVYILDGVGNDISFPMLVEKLHLRFGTAYQSPLYRAQLKARRRQPGESLRSLYQDISHLSIIAYPGNDFVLREEFVNS